MGGYYYTARQGDMWDYIAWLVYGDEMQMEKLLGAEENRELLGIYLFSAGVRVWCPKLEEQTAPAGIPPWRDAG